MGDDVKSTDVALVGRAGVALVLPERALPEEFDEDVLVEARKLATIKRANRDHEVAKGMLAEAQALLEETGARVAAAIADHRSGLPIAPLVSSRATPDALSTSKKPWTPAQHKAQETRVERLLAEVIDTMIKLHVATPRSAKTRRELSTAMGGIDLNYRLELLVQRGAIVRFTNKGASKPVFFYLATPKAPDGDMGRLV